jgi:WS/DGAT/MGAT family acyltransferase
MSAKTMSFFDYSFFLIETRENPKHVAKLMTFSKPKGCKKSFVKDVYRRWLKIHNAAAPFNSKLGFSYTGIPQWAEVDHFDPANHLYHHNLPAGSDRKKFNAFICELHAPLTPRDKPLWEMHLIDGLKNDQFAIYLRMHHAYVDGLSFISIITTMLSKSPDDKNCQPFWVYSFKGSDRAKDKKPLASRLLKKMGTGISGAYGLARIGAQIGLEISGLTHNAITIPFHVEKSVLTGQIAEGRELFTTKISMERINRIRKVTRSSLNHVVLACLEGALRRYLVEIGHPIEGPVVISMAVSIREDVGKLGGNEVGMVPVELCSKTDDPVLRIRNIGQSLQAVRHQVDDTSNAGIAAYTLALLSLPQLAENLKLSDHMPPLGHTVVSNVPGPAWPLYLEGAEVDEAYFVSALAPGQNLNVTVSSYNGDLYYGLLAVRGALPDLNRLIELIDQEYRELEAILDSSDLGLGLLNERREGYERLSATA